MHVLREESDRTLQESHDLSDFGRDLLAHYDSIGADLKSLVDEWENARAFLTLSVDRQTSPRNSKSPESIDGATLVGDTPRNSALFGKDGGGWADAAGMGLFSQAEEEAEQVPVDETVEEVFEAVAEPPKPRVRSQLSREERIRRVQEERARAAEARKSADVELAVQRELQNVLLNRPAPRRKYNGRPFSG